MSDDGHFLSIFEDKRDITTIAGPDDVWVIRKGLNDIGEIVGYPERDGTIWFAIFSEETGMVINRVNSRHVEFVGYT